MQIGIFVSETWGPGSTIEEIRHRARRAEALGFRSGWVPSLPWSLDPLASIQAAGEATESLELGSAVIPTYFQHPLTLARQAASVQAAIGRPIHLGIGCSNEAVLAMHGLPCERPARHTREYLEVLGPALRAGAVPRGEREHAGFVEYAGDFFRVASIYGTPGAKAPGSLLVGALGPHMLRVAGRFADGTIATWSNAQAIEQAIAPALRRAAEAARRPASRIAGVVPIVLSEERETGCALARQHFEVYASLPRYKRIMELGGTDDVSDVCVVGNAEQIAEQFQRFEKAGMTDLLAAPLLSDGVSWEEVAETLASITR